MAWWRSAWTSPLGKVMLETTSRSLPEKLSNVQSGNLNSWKNLWTPDWGLLLVKVMKLDWAGTMYEVLGLEGPYQSNCSGRIVCAINLIERSSTILDSLYDGPELEGIKFDSRDIIGLADEEYPNVKGDALLRLLSNLAVE